MAKGSQYLQLKTALSTAGLSRQSQPKKGQKRKRATGDEGKDYDKKAAKLQKIVADLNPFDVKVTKLKHDVGGRKLKGVTGRPGLSKQVGIEQRKKSLLVEYEQRNKTGSFVDRRFGENDPSLAPEDRMLERFTRERQRASKGVAFNLEDEDELTHYGQSLAAMDDFDEGGLGLSDDDEEQERGQIDPKTVRTGHFGGFEDTARNEAEEDEPSRKKTKAEVMAEVIAKSKDHKYLRQLEKERDDALRQSLDEEFNSIRGLLFSKPDPSSTGSNREPLGRARPVLLSGSAEKLPAEPTGESDDEYDKYIRELAFDKRSKGTDRLKTEEELALEEKGKLEKAERARLRRMRGEVDVDSDDEDKRKGRKRQRVADADDLEDDLDLEDDTAYGLGAGLGADGAGASADAGETEEGDEDEDEEGEEQSGTEPDSDLQEEMGEALDIKSDGNSLEDAAVQRKPSTWPAGKKSSKPKELPFVFPCPTTHDEFLEIVDGIDDADIPTAVHRIRVMYHPSLAEDNKLKLQTFVEVLLDHIIYVASPPDPSFILVAALVPHLKALTTSYPIAAAEAFVAKLVVMQKNLARGLARGALLPDSKTWPGPGELALLRITGLLWSTSDLSHPVVAPAYLLLGQYLAQSRVRSPADLASGLFLCTLCLQYTALSKRLVPEALNFLNNTLLYLLPNGMGVDSLPGSFPSPDFTGAVAALRLTEKQMVGLIPSRPDLIALLGKESQDGVQERVDLVGAALSLVLRFAQLHTSLDAFIELYEPTCAILTSVQSSKFSPPLLKQYSDAVDGLTRMLKFSKQARKPLRLQAHKPIPIATYIPKFDERFHGRRHDPDSERNEAAKLRAQFRQERKGAIREIRKDNRFLASERAKKQDEKDKAYKAKMARVEGEITVERHEEKLMEREKLKQKRRAGKK